MGKSVTITIRLCLFLHVFEFCVNSLRDLTDANSLTINQQIVDACQNIIDTMPNAALVIKKHSVLCAIDLADFFLKNKLILAGYLINNNESTSEFIERL